MVNHLMQVLDGRLGEKARPRLTVLLRNPDSVSLAFPQKLFQVGLFLRTSRVAVFNDPIF